MITTVLSIDLKCCCGRGAVVTADTLEIALATFRQRGWVASTEDLRAFYQDGMQVLPKLYCSEPCWTAKEFIAGMEALIEKHFGAKDELIFDTAMECTPWVVNLSKVPVLVKAIKSARPGTTERRLRRRKIVR